MGVLGRIWRLERARGGKDGLTEAGLGRKDGASALVRLYWLRGVIEKKRAFCRGSTGLHECVVVLGRLD